MASDTRIRDQRTTCGLDWCRAHPVPCDCVFSAMEPHARVDCRYVDQEDDEQ